MLKNKRDVYKMIFRFCAVIWVKPPTIPLPLQTAASRLKGKQSSIRSPLWPPHGGPPVTRQASSRSHTSRGGGGGGFSLSTIMSTQLPAFLRALTASWWVAVCILRPLTWKHSGVTLHLQGSVKVGALVRSVGLNYTLGSLGVACLFPPQTLINQLNYQSVIPKIGFCNLTASYWLYRWAEDQQNVLC